MKIAAKMFIGALFLSGCAATEISGSDINPESTISKKHNWYMVPIETGILIPVVCTAADTCSAMPKQMYLDLSNSILQSAGV